MNEKFPKMDVRSSIPHTKCVCIFTPRLLSHSPKVNGINEAQGVKISGLYTCIGCKVGQKTPKYLLVSL